MVDNKESKVMKMRGIFKLFMFLGGGTGKEAYKETKSFFIKHFSYGRTHHIQERLYCQ